jgi:hypothetical protein
MATTQVPRKFTRIDEDLVETLRKIAFDTNVSVTKVVNILIREALAARGAK